MTETEFVEVCNLQQAGLAVTVGYEQIDMTGKLIGCWEEYLVIDINGTQALWPSEVCDIKQRTYHIPSYS